MPSSLPGCFSAFLKPKQKTRATKARDEPQKALLDDRLPRRNDDKSEEPQCRYLNLCCDYSCNTNGPKWSEDDKPPEYPGLDAGDLWAQDILSTIDQTVNDHESDLRILSLQLHDHPELGFEEKYAHDLLTNFLADRGFKVTKHYLGLNTAWRAEFTHLKGGRVLGINSEMDALQGMGHACGHNLIAVSGVGVALAAKAALEAHNIPGTIILLGTPAEEGGGGKIILLDRGAYDEMDACVMCHPGPGPAHSASTGTTIAMQSIEVEYFGHSAHAGAAPWEGTNALDAAFLAYSSISVLRQQVRPDHRVHGIVSGRDWATNVIPDYAKMQWIIRTPTYPDLAIFKDRVQACFEAAALATGCKVRMNFAMPYYDLQQNATLAHEFADIIGNRYGYATSTASSSASTDFGNISYELPSLHPLYAIPTTPHGANHTPEFAKSARSPKAHEATMVTTKALAQTGIRLLRDDEFFYKVKQDHARAVFRRDI
ncbi:hypothetical protein HGRIS_005001 [Hohenbuehelia grisea]|uniref:Peptidase M20 dimerisation domain-containing protein n=1 Tax=Hohenbuehelia grisea TaxID=104357 RepID=A0ABR3JDN5_9AGAR